MNPLLERLLDQDLLPTPLLRFGIRRLLRSRLREETVSDTALQQEAFNAFLDNTAEAPLAVDTQAANEQHYELPPAFFEHCLGPHLKYSCAWWPDQVEDLGVAEEAMLQLTCERARLADGQAILELGCGWGALTLWMARAFPRSRILAVSNSAPQREFILARAAEQGLDNIEVLTADINDFATDRTFDRVVSVEMFEHVKNHRLLLQRISGWLNPGGCLFVHIFTHRSLAYHFVARDPSDWMSRYFFTGGMMPSDHLLLYHQEHLRLQRHWRVNGRHYSRTAEAWLANMQSHRKKILPLFEETYGPGQARRWWAYWKIFFLACSELWRFRGGNEWFVSHYLFQAPSP